METRLLKELATIKRLLLRCPLCMSAFPYQHRSSRGSFQQGPGSRDLQGRLPQRAFPSLRWWGRSTRSARPSRVVLWWRRRRRGRRREWCRPGVGPWLLWVSTRQTEAGETQAGEAPRRGKMWAVQWIVSPYFFQAKGGRKSCWLPNASKKAKLCNFWRDPGNKNIKLSFAVHIEM